MNLLAQPRLPKWPFLLGDVVLVAVAYAIFQFERAPLSTTDLWFIFVCVAFGAVLGVVPFIADFARSQREAAADLQLKVEAQNNKLHNAAELLMTAANQLKSAQEAAARTCHLADNLPYRMQEKIGEFTAQLQQSEDEEKAAMAKELDGLRETEGERITAIAEKIRAAAKELVALDKEIRPALEAAGKQGRELEPALGAASKQAQAAIAQAGIQLQTTLAAAEAKLQQTAEQAEARLAARLAELRASELEFDRAMQQRLERLKSATEAIVSTPVVVAPEPRLPRKESEKSAATRPAEALARAEHSASAPLASPPLRTAGEVDPGKTAGSEAAGSKPRPVAPLSAPAPESTPAPPKVAPDATAGKTDSPGTPIAAAEPTPRTAAPETNPAESASPPPKREPRRRTKEPAESERSGPADPEVVYDEPVVAPVVTVAKTSDGTTRLLVTAYIGIGNKVFLRGAGPGLGWERGVPMDFVSIGKWSWQTTDATAPFAVQFFKNDEVKALGEPVTVPPGHHVEVSPTFREPESF